MNIIKRMSAASVLFLSVGGFHAYATEKPHYSTEYQYGTISALLAGDYQQKVSVEQAKDDGNNFGVGAGIGLGEVVAVNGEYFIADPHGNMREMKDGDGLSFLTATDFKKDDALSFAVNKKITLAKLQAQISNKMKNNQNSYAVLVKGKFARVLARSENYDKEMGTPLVEWLKHNENRYMLKDVAGTFVMFYSPKYVAGFGVPGYHTHFLSQDDKLGGHVLNAEITKAEVEIMPILNINLRPGLALHHTNSVDLSKVHSIENADLE